MWYKRNLFHFHHSCHRDHFPHHSQAADERCKEARSQPFHSWCKETAWKLRQGSDPADCSSTSIQQVSLSSIRGIWFPALVFRLVSAFRDKLERCHSVRKGQCYLKTDYYYNRSNENFQTDCVLGQTKEKILKYWKVQITRSNFTGLKRKQASVASNIS